MEDLKIKIENKFKKLNKEYKEMIYNALKQKDGALYKCFSSICNKQWRSNKIETKCKFCNSNQIGIVVDEKSKPQKTIFLFSKWSD